MCPLSCHKIVPMDTDAEWASLVRTPWLAIWPLLSHAIFSGHQFFDDFQVPQPTNLFVSFDYHPTSTLAREALFALDVMLLSKSSQIF